MSTNESINKSVNEIDVTYATIAGRMTGYAIAVIIAGLINVGLCIRDTHKRVIK